MKTVIDSVNEFKGGWPLLRYTTDNWYEDGCNLFHNEETICSEDEFIATAAECETNFGECKQSYSDYEFDYRLHLALKRNKPTKELDMDIDWSKAPEGATHYILGVHKFANSDFVIEESDRYTGTSAGISYWPKADLVVQSDFKVIERPIQPTPIFTQEMADNAVLPGVGMECRLGELLVVYILGKTRNFELTGQLAYEIIGGDGERINETGTSSGNFKPLTPPTPLINGKAYQFDFIGCAFLGFYHDKSDEFTASKSGMNSVICRLDDCTNIQPLTVEVK